jgi:hypothetical protein
MRSARINGTAGLGFVAIASQTTAPATPASGAALYVNSDNNLAWKIPSGFIASLNTQNITSDRTFEFPNSSGQLITDATLTALKGVANGIAGLDSGSKVSSSNIPTATSTAIGGVYGVMNTVTASMSVGQNTIPNHLLGFIGCTAVGSAALQTAGSGANSNTAVGYQSCRVLTSGTSNSAVGRGSLGAITTGDNNAALGNNAGLTLTTGSRNTFISTGSNTTSAAGNDRIAIGYNASATADAQLAIAPAITHINAPGLTAAADGTGVIMSWDAASTIMRPSAGTNNTVALIDTALSARELTANKNQPSGYVGLGSDSKVLTTYLPRATKSFDGTLCGIAPGTGNQYSLVSLGYQASGSASTSADSKVTAIGWRAGQSLATGSTNNTLVGASAAAFLSSGINNVIAGSETAAGLQTGSRNVLLGTAITISSARSDTIALGHGATLTADAQFAIASAITHVNAPGLTAASDGTGTLLSFDASGIIRPSAGTNKTVALIDTALSARELTANKDVANGYAGLDSTSLLDSDKLLRTYTGNSSSTWDGAATFTQDSDVTISADTTMTNDIICKVLTVDTGFTLTTAGYGIWCEKLVDNGTIANNGSNGGVGGASPSTGGAGASAATFGGGMPGGSADSNTTQPTAATAFYGGAFDSAFYGRGGGAGTIAAGGLGTPGISNQNNSYYIWKRNPGCNTLLDAVGRYIWAGSGGGAGSGDGTNYGGSGGGGAGIVFINAKTITGTGVINAIGGNGGNATIGDCGGGGAGSGGVIIIHTLMNPADFTITASVSGGTPGTGSGSGGTGSTSATGIIRVFSPWTAAMP